MNVVELKNVTKRFDEFVAVKNLSFEVRKGAIFGLLGPNGAGKTTSIRMIVNIFAPDSGEVVVLGEHVTTALQQRIGYLPEERGLYKKMKVGEQLIFFANLKGVPADVARTRVDQWLKRMELLDWKDKKAADLSKGMQQKIQFISTVLHDPDLLILDEPFSGLDPVNVEFMIDVLAEFRTKEKTIIFSTHLMETAERLCSDILLINKAKKVIGGSLRKVKEAYGKNLIALRCEGGDGVLADRSLIASLEEHSDEREIQLTDGADAQVLLKKLIDAGATITKFEQVEPSLNDIFIQQVGAGSGSERGRGVHA